MSTSTDGAIFDGIDDYIALTPFQIGGAFSIESYFKFDSTISYSKIFEFVDSSGSSSNNWFNIYRDATTNNLAFSNYPQTQSESCQCGHLPRLGCSLKVNEVFGILN